MPVRVNVQPYRPPDALRAEVAGVAATVLQGLVPVALVGEDLALPRPPSASPKVGTLAWPTTTPRSSTTTCASGYDNLYACDNSVFPSSRPPTSAALALRLARPHRQRLNGKRRARRAAASYAPVPTGRLDRATEHRDGLRTEREVVAGVQVRRVRRSPGVVGVQFGAPGPFLVDLGHGTGAAPTSR